MQICALRHQKNLLTLFRSWSDKRRVRWAFFPLVRAWDIGSVQQICLFYGQIGQGIGNEVTLNLAAGE